MEILNNTIIRLIFRQGAESDRQTTTFASGEPIYTTDYKRLYIGDGSVGGVLVGNKFQGITSDLTTLTPSVPGDTAFNVPDTTLYVLLSGSGSNLADWFPISNIS